jgi:hypothetical protein
MGKVIKVSDGREYSCAHNWPEDCFVQGDDFGIVFDTQSLEKSYTTAFFEAFPKNPETFIRGEGVNIAQAEEGAWQQYQKILNCPGHEFERRGYTNGAGFCKHCDLFNSNAFEPLTKCKVCEKPTTYAVDVDGNHYCEDHQRDIPLEKWTAVSWLVAYRQYYMYCRGHKIPYNAPDRMAELASSVTAELAGLSSKKERKE